MGKHRGHLGAKTSSVRRAKLKICSNQGWRATALPELSYKELEIQRGTMAMDGIVNLIDRVTDNVEKLWIMPRPEGWQGKHAGKKRAAFVTKTQLEAIAEGRPIAKNGKDELIITDKHNIIRQKDSEGNDSRKIHG